MNAADQRDGAATGVLDWTATDTRPASLDAMTGYAKSVVHEIAAGRPLHHLHRHMEELLDRFEQVMGTREWGVGLELGAGAGYASAMLSRRPGVRLVYVHDQSRELVEDVMPRMFAAAAADEEKLVRVVGDLTRFELDDGSIDFVLAIAALHHAEDLSATVREIERVLRVGGFALVLDRYQPDYLTRADLDEVLAVPVDPEAGAAYGLAGGATRADIGEHEIRLAEWKYHFMQGHFATWAFTAFTFSRTWWARIVGPPWLAFLERFGERTVLRARRPEVLGAQLPLDLRWLMRTDPPSPTNLMLVARKYASST